MKGFLVGCVVTAPLTVLVMLYVLQWQSHIDTRLERAEVRHEVQREEFNRDFHAAWDALGAGNCGPSGDRQRASDARLSELRERLARLEAQMQNARGDLATDINALKSAINDAATGQR